MLRDPYDYNKGNLLTVIVMKDANSCTDQVKQEATTIEVDSPPPYGV